MRLRASRVERFGATLATALGNATARWPRREGLRLTLVDAEGHEGRGEAAPLPGFSPDSANECARAFADLPARLGDLPTLEEHPDAVEAVVRRLAVPPTARFALETALFDLAGLRCGRSVAELLGGSRTLERVPRSGLVGAGDGDPVEEARVLVARGIRTVKAKIGRGPLDAELASLRRLRDALGADLALRLDANGAWNPARARTILARLRELAVDFVEQPVPAAELLSLGPCAVPWAADESLLDPTLAERLLDAPGCAAFVIKPGLLGGLVAARRLCVRALDRGLGVVVTHGFEGPVALAAACELALSLPRAPLACGLDTHPALAVWPAESVPQLAREGFVCATGRAGLGLAGRGARAAL